MLISITFWFVIRQITLNIADNKFNPDYAIGMILTPQAAKKSPE
jgi:hypothetical protein